MIVNIDLKYSTQSPFPVQFVQSDRAFLISLGCIRLAVYRDDRGPWDDDRFQRLLDEPMLRSFGKVPQCKL
jgi:hypothetical protein